MLGSWFMFVVAAAFKQKRILNPLAGISDTSIIFFLLLNYEIKEEKGEPSETVLKLCFLILIVGDLFFFFVLDVWI